VYVFDNKVSNSRLYVEDRIGISGSFILTAIISFSMQKEKISMVFSMKEHMCTRNPSFVDIFIEK
jgi:hypothetical protein